MARKRVPRSAALKAKAALAAVFCEQDLYEQIGRLQMELAWLKKKSRFVQRVASAFVQHGQATATGPI